MTRIRKNPSNKKIDKAVENADTVIAIHGICDKKDIEEYLLKEIKSEFNVSHVHVYDEDECVTTIGLKK